MYVIRETRHYYGPRRAYGLVMASDRAAIYPTRAEASAAIAELDAERYYLDSGEYQRPTYRVARADSLPTYLSIMI